MTNIQSVTLDTLKRLRTEQAMSALKGDYRGYKRASKEFASLAVKDFKTAQKVKGPVVTSVPLFSKTGMKMAKVWFLNLFRIKSADERKLSKMYEDLWLRRNYLNK